MSLKSLFVSGRSITAEIEGTTLYHLDQPQPLMLNGEAAGTAETTVFTLYGLLPDTEYTLATPEDTLTFRTLPETVTMDVRLFGAVGDGVHNDTPAIQAAIACCPPDGRVLIPAGAYRVTPLFLKSHIRIELAKGAVLQLDTDRNNFPVLPGSIEGTDGKEYNQGTWEGDPMDCYGALITGMGVEDVVLYGQGMIDGCAPDSDWWVDPKTRRGAWRGRMVFLNRCKNITLQGITVQNSPSWNLHPYFSEELRFLSLTINAPKDSPNTDGFDPESCKNVLMAGCHFSLGDDCIAVKSGKIYMGSKYHVPCENVQIRHCLMENGHGGMTIGSEMAGGIKNVLVQHCLMRNTDRGLRVKTRRGRGEHGVIDNIVFENVKMERVGTPLVVNALYFCDPDGHSEYVQSRKKQPIDQRTPRIGSVTFRHVRAEDATCAGYLLGLPERPIEGLTLEDVQITLAPDAEPMVPAMADGVEKTSRRGLVAINTAEVILKDVTITGMDGEMVEHFWTDP